MARIYAGFGASLGPRDRFGLGILFIKASLERGVFVPLLTFSHFCVVFWRLSGMTWHEYLPAKFGLFSMGYSGFGCTGCHFSYLLYFFIFFHGTEYCKIDTNRHQIGATGQKSGIFLLAGVGGMWCHFGGHWCHLLGLFLSFGDFLHSMCHCITRGRVGSSGKLSHQLRFCQAGGAEPLKADQFGRAVVDLLDLVDQ